MEQSSEREAAAALRFFHVSRRSFSCLIWAKSLPALAASSQNPGSEESFSFSCISFSSLAGSKTPPYIEDLRLQIVYRFGQFLKHLFLLIR
jgi:hypothetical protein